MAATCVPKLYRSVIDDVITNVREYFLDEGVDEQILQELKQVWEKKVLESKAVEPKKPEVIEHHVIPVQGQTLQPIRQVTQTAQQIPMSSGNIQQAYQFNSDVIHAGQKNVTITLPAQGGHGSIQTVLSAPTATATLALPPEITASLFPHGLRQGAVLNNAQTLQSDHTSTRIQYQPLNAEYPKHPQFTMAIGQPPVSNQSIPKQTSGIIQLDGANDTSDDDDDDDSHEEIRDEDDDDQNMEEENGKEEEPLNSDDDVSDEDANELFCTDNVVVCQYDKITRTRNRWKFHLKDGIMNLKGKDYVFQKANGDAEW